MEKIGELSAAFANLKLTVAAVEKRVAVLESSCGDVPALRRELLAAQAQLREVECGAVATDIIINGIPQADGENLREIFEKICDVAEHKPPPLRDVFRLRSKGGKSNLAPIVVKLMCAHDRGLLFKSVALARRAKKRPFTLADIGQPGYGQFYLHESLPKALREVMSYASELRRKKLLVAVFSIRGKVFVRLKPNEEAKVVSSKEEIDSLLSTT